MEIDEIRIRPQLKGFIAQVTRKPPAPAQNAYPSPAMPYAPGFTENYAFTTAQEVAEFTSELLG